MRHELWSSKQSYDLPPWSSQGARGKSQSFSRFSSFLFQISRCLKAGGRFVSITFVSPLLRKRLYACREYDWSIRKYSYGEGFEYFVYVMTKGEELGPEDAALQEKRPQDHKPSDLFVHSETAEEFLCNIHLWQIWITLVVDYLRDLELSLIPQPLGSLPYFCLTVVWFFLNCWSQFF